MRGGRESVSSSGLRPPLCYLFFRTVSSPLEKINAASRLLWISQQSLKTEESQLALFFGFSKALLSSKCSNNLSSQAEESKSCKLKPLHEGWTQDKLRSGWFQVSVYGYFSKDLCSKAKYWSGPIHTSYIFRSRTNLSLSTFSRKCYGLF